MKYSAAGIKLKWRTIWCEVFRFTGSQFNFSYAPPGIRREFLVLNRSRQKLRMGAQHHLGSVSTRRKEQQLREVSVGPRAGSCCPGSRALRTPGSSCCSWTGLAVWRGERILHSCWCQWESAAYRNETQLWEVSFIVREFSSNLFIHCQRS